MQENNTETVETNSVNKSDDSNLNPDEQVNDNSQNSEGTTEVNIEETDEFKKAVTLKVESVVKDRLSREAAKNASLESAIDLLKQEKETLETQLVSFNEQAEKIEAAEYENTVLKLSIEKDLKPEIIRKLNGRSYDDLAESIDLVKDLTNTKSNKSTDELFKREHENPKLNSFAQAVNKKH